MSSSKKAMIFELDNNTVSLIRSREEIVLFVLMTLHDTNNSNSIERAILTGFAAYLEIMNAEKAGDELPRNVEMDVTSEFEQFIPEFEKMMFEAFDKQISDKSKRAEAKEAVEFALAA